VGISMQRSDGFPTNALVVVTRVLLRILRDERPGLFLFVKDGKGKNFRHDLFPLYKANRDATPEDLVRQMEPIVRMVKALGIPVEISDGCEADDCIASLAARFSAQRPVIIVSGDKDLKQCLGPNVYMITLCSKIGFFLVRSKNAYFANSPSPAIAFAAAPASIRKATPRPAVDGEHFFLICQFYASFWLD
jgi:5''-3'' exonuclease (including N-terminal domain of PolI)